MKDLQNPSSDFETQAELSTPALAHAAGCTCALHARRRLASAMVGGAALSSFGLAQARDGVDVGANSKFAKLVPAEQIEESAAQQYSQLLADAKSKNALAPDNYPQVVRLRAIAERLIPLTYEWNARAKDWKWEINLLGSKEINAFCMPGGKIAFYNGILKELQLTDDEVAMVMGHEMAHALREHARERIGKSTATQLGAGLLSSILGLGNAGNAALNIGTQLVSLRWSRGDESEADLVGLDIAARAGYNPESGVTLWQKMTASSKGAPPQWLSTHPAGDTRIKEIQAALPKVQPLYQRAEKPKRRFDVQKKG